MNEPYKAFVRDFHRCLLELGISVPEAAAVLYRCPQTVNNWLNYKSVMEGDDMALIIAKFMHGRYERR